jgi:hypothetical protein
MFQNHSETHRLLVDIHNDINTNLISAHTPNGEIQVDVEGAVGLFVVLRRFAQDFVFYSFSEAKKNVSVNVFFTQAANSKRTKTYANFKSDWQPKGHRFEPVILHLIVVTASAYLNL